MLKNSKAIFSFVSALALSAALVLLTGCSMGDSLRSANGETPRYIAHRGLSGEFYENSEQAFIKAGESDFFYGIETDIWKTADGGYVCAHDNNPFRDDAKLLISDAVFADALALPLKESSCGKFLGGDERLVGFERFLDICAEYRKAPVIEFKCALGQSDARDILTPIKEKGLFERAIFISFSKESLDAVREIDGTATVQWLRFTVGKDFYGDVSIMKTFVGKTEINRVHAAHKKVGIWTVNSKADAKKFARFGADYITTNYDFSKGEES